MKTSIQIAFNCYYLIGLSIIVSCRAPSHHEMVRLLKELNNKNNTIENPFNPGVKSVYIDSLLQLPQNKNNFNLLGLQGSLLLKTGQEEKSINTYKELIGKMDYMSIDNVMPEMAIAYMRLGERSNCMLNHNGSSCVFPIKNQGVHKLQTGSRKAIEIYETILKNHPEDLESKWLLNIAFMTLGEYPKNVPKEFLLSGLDVDTGLKVKPFTDIAPDLGLNINGRAGGVIIDDFNNDGYLDILTSGWGLDDQMHYFQNNKDGSFNDLTEQSGLTGITGGLNIQQTDYNNDGNLDVFVLRGAWNTQGYGNQPSSLIRNNGDGTFTDVTTTSGLMFFHPTQAATWADFNNDGWLDVFLGAEDSGLDDKGGPHPCALFLNNHDGTFTNVTEKAHCNITAFVKGVTAADYNNDGRQDIFIPTLNGEKILLKNKGIKNQIPEFENVSEKAGLSKNHDRTFTTWFYDYNNDGWPDILVCDYQFDHSLGYYSAAEASGKPVPNAGNVFLYKNNHDGTFTDVSKETGLDKVVFSMGANFGDIDNDGWLDMYFGTGSPDFKSLVPNKLFKNVEGKRFADVTLSSRTGNLQKGHGVAFADFRNSGIQDIFIEMGGAYPGDAYTSLLYENPGQNNNNWISLKLEGIKTNKVAIGSRIKVSFTENGIKRRVFKDVNSGGSFGSSSLRQEIGIGQANVIEEIEIKWAGSNKIQTFKNIKPNQFLHITEGGDEPTKINLKKLVYKLKPNPSLCLPITSSLGTK